MSEITETIISEGTFNIDKPERSGIEEEEVNSLPSTNDKNDVNDQTTAATTDKTDKTKDERLAAKFAAISRQERQLQQEREKLKKEQEEIQKYKKARENASNDPLAYLQESGLTLEGVIQAGLGTKPEPKVEDRIKELQDRIERKEQEDKANQEKLKQEQANAQVEQFKSQIKKHIEENSDKYELIKLGNAESEVFDLILGILDQTTKAGKPKYISIDEAAQKIEQYYETHLDEIFGKSKKLASKYQKIIQEQEKSNQAQDSTDNLENSDSQTVHSILKNNMVTAKPAEKKVYHSQPLTLEQQKAAALKRSLHVLKNYKA
jgi:vacuolar-type H+-ATPase subunit I/STV1